MVSVQRPSVFLQFLTLTAVTCNEDGSRLKIRNVMSTCNPQEPKTSDLLRSSSATHLPMIPSPTQAILLTLSAVLIISSSIASGSSISAAYPPYTNHTVGDRFGWHFNRDSNASVTNYTAWSSSISFFLGDFLIFNTDAKSTIIQTYNATTYSLCSIDYDYGNLTSQFGIDDTEDEGNDGGVPVLLSREKENYFFSNSDNGFQCRKGMRFKINVQHGNGLPVPSPPPPPPLPSPLIEVTERSAGAMRCNVALGLLLVMIWVHLFGSYDFLD